ncbi:MAG: tRNA (adenosine(37)-N6)-threonylcarbamoyltransferase complex dimerization subunit type 1 TsaB [Candidatus Omnitrophica bacterium]|nr:tRNA (adenosine(37)-N6)-threonylcarbamoyltransferase complex dimerization subunit type 1 TsaB [Candidatus Omnitrophota bacterium]MBU2044298.1 tRNA (adenosine(37)-N6)-threonylcarbamoyltransferase complex dimerization subunit type 1 TsaB [Candidatus Omnitrophota bacterium]MBU2250861.1 tRNA (adenosine(37)-N6)-threonylcarbamoyltransferase complex dimerization subunit type 1 TsaB [Candidatus Omnitrophota bacterium]MBU2473315.1 tRNA (adenosine(37)-N6)-threonylcarbamoyltransferase complex dimerizati
MNLLAVEASSENISLCIKYRGKVISDFNRKIQFGASLLIQQIDWELRKNRIKLKEIDAFVVGQGPGSFTGLRISFSLIKAFMLATQKPAIMVGSFFSCAERLKKDSNKIAVISDARRNLIYAASFKVKDGALKKEAKEKLCLLEEFISTKKDYLFVSYDRNLRDKSLVLEPKLNFYSKDIYPSAGHLLLQAELCYNKGNFTPIEKLKPLYLHPKTCQIRKNK